MISYYELLGMVKEGNAPKKISVSLTYGTMKTYEATYDGGEFSYYWLTSNISNENYKNYLTECFLESMMFDECITILDEENEFEDIAEITCNDEKVELGTMIKWLGSPLNDNEVKICSTMDCLGVTLNKVIKNQKKIIEKLKENDN